MNRIVTAIVLAAVSTAASWVVRRLLSRSAAAKPRPQIENWENEGGALAPHHAAIETSQVPR
jgi:hypothetical protein